ncbi:hypothetical protein [Brachybacterium huguangmaarense]
MPDPRPPAMPDTTTASFLEGRALLLLSPHADDAVFSAAALLERGSTEVWTVFAGVPEPDVATDWDRACGFDSGAALMRARREEDALALAGVPLRPLDLLERAYARPAERAADLRTLAGLLGTWAEAHPDGMLALPVGAGVSIRPAWWETARDRVRGVLRRRRGRGAAPSPIPALPSVTGAPPAATDTTPTGADPDAAPVAGARALGGAAASARRVLRRAAQAGLAPLRRAMHADAMRRREAARRTGMLANEDHVAVRDVGLGVAAARGIDVVLYEDLPYGIPGLGRPGDAAASAVAERTGRTAEAVSVAPRRAEKLSRISRYVTQLPVMDPGGAALGEETLPAAERLWLLPR